MMDGFLYIHNKVGEALMQAEQQIQQLQAIIAEKDEIIEALKKEKDEHNGSS